jgi:ABC-type transporter lipoprotein component MlaA/pimeloyl-ACP methyl ester carboxylesterase
LPDHRETSFSERRQRAPRLQSRGLRPFHAEIGKAFGLKIKPGWKIRYSALLTFAICLPACAGGGPPSVASNGPPVETVILPKSVPDPIEPVNRVIWGFNRAVITGVIQPTSKVYRSIAVKPVRTGISNFGRNITFPDRLINNLLQGKLRGARDESTRFLCNSTFGVAGIFDVASKWKIPKADADFGQTFGQWGWKPACFIMLPIYGPSNERDALGLAADSASNPLLYISPYDFDIDNPLTYLGPYSYLSYAVMYNDLADTVDEYARFSQAETDPYSEIQYAWTFARENRVADFQVKGEQDKATLETIESVFFTCQDSKFPSRGRTLPVVIPTTGRKLEFTFWLRREKAPVVYIVPGLGAHRLAETCVALAELVYNKGFSAVCVSSPFNPEFMEHASTANLPGYLPVDGRDLEVALAEIDRHLNGIYPNRLTRKALLGYSMGAFQTLYLAATEPTNQPPLIHFDRYVAINPPVQLLHGISKLDEFYEAPLDWPAAARTDDLENTFLKVADLNKRALTPQTPLRFNAIESKFLIGLMFRLTLRDIIFSSQRRNNQGVLQHRIRNLRREPVYQEILRYSYHDYFERFVIPYYRTRSLAAPVEESLARAADLRTYTGGLRANPDIRVIGTENDFLLTDEDLAWLRATFAPDQITLFKEGGHLGNLTNPAVLKTIWESLADLKPLPAK